VPVRSEGTLTNDEGISILRSGNGDVYILGYHSGSTRREERKRLIEKWAAGGWKIRPEKVSDIRKRNILHPAATEGSKYSGVYKLEREGPLE